MMTAEPDQRPWILHVDLDQFLAAVEVRRHPELAGRPVVVVLAADNSAYEAASAEVMAALRSLDGVAVEVWGWDEACVGVTTTDPEAFARHLQDAVHRATRLWCAVGIGETKLQAKAATGSPSRAASPGSPAARGCPRWATARSRRSRGSAPAPPGGWAPSAS